MSRSYKNQFQDAADKPKKREVAQPFSFRITPSEKERLKALAGNEYVSDYIRRVALNGNTNPRKTSRKPRIDDAKFAQLLGALGASRLSANLNQIAKGANLGTIPLTEDLTDELAQACADVRAMRHDLISALGLRSQE